LAQKAQAVLGWGWHAAQRAASAGGVAAKRAQTAARQALEPMLKQPEPAPVAEGDYPTLVAAAQKQQQARNGAAAEALWRQALALRPQSNEALVALGWCRLQAHDAPVALGHFGQAAALAPQSAEAQFGLAEAKRMAHDVPGAKAAYGRYLELEPNGPLAPLCHHMLEELSHEG
jgi:tetratricopeptide (TPR) repeat protein